MILNRRGRPSATKSKRRYLNAVKKDGFNTAHLQMLRELKARLDKKYKGASHKIAQQADTIEGAFVWMAREAKLDVPPIEERDKLFIQVFGQAGKRIIDAEIARADNDVKEFMAETGITDEAEARRLLVDGMVEGMEFFVENKDAIIREADLMEQIEDVIGPVDWADLGDE